MKHGLVFALLLVFSGCAWKLPKEYRTTQAEKAQIASRVEFSEPIISGATADEEMLISQALKRLPLAVVGSVKKINVSGDVTHFRRKPEQKDKDIPIGHNCDPKDDAIFCIRRPYVSDFVVWHEATHVYHYSLLSRRPPPGEPYFYKAWDEVAGDVYGDDYLDPESEGIITSYGRKNRSEDVSVWVEYCLIYLYHPEDQRISPLAHNKHLKTDKRYRKKLELLYKYGFLMTSQYEQLKPLFQ